MIGALHFAQGSWLWALLLLPLIWVVPKEAYKSWVHCLIRTGVLAAILLGLAQPQWVRARSAGHIVHVVDRSQSVLVADRDTVDARVAAALDALPDDTRRHVIRIALDSTTSSLGAALAAARDRIPAGDSGAVVLWSDGATTATDEVRHTSSDAVPVHTVQLASDRSVTRIVGLHVPEQPIQGRSTRVEVIVDALDDGDPDGIAVHLRQDVTLLAEVIVPNSIGRHVLSLDIEPSTAGPVRWTAEIFGPADERGSLSRVVNVLAPLRVAYVRGGMDEGATGWQHLLGRGADVRTVDVSALPSTDLRNVDALVLDDVAAEYISAKTQGAIMRAVQQDGLGLIVTGGRDAFGPGGWHDEPLATVFPVEAVQKEEKRDPSTSLVLIIDTSGSMSGLRVQLAKEVARLAIKRLLPHDKVGIVEFYGAKRWAAPLQPASNAIEIQRALNRLDAGGGTVIMPAIEEAYYGLQNVDTRFKHVLVLTDGGVESGAFEPLLRKMAEKGINTSTVLCGPGAHSDFLIEISQWGKGRYYNVPDRFNLPEVILKQPTTSRLPGYRSGSYPIRVRGGPGWWGPLGVTDAPDVNGYVETRARIGAEVLIESKGAAHPILASWRHGAGRVTTMTTEPVGEGAAQWRDWPSYAPLWFRVIARTARDALPPYSITLTEDGPRVRVDIRRRQGTDTPICTVGDDPSPLPLRQRAPDLWSTWAVDSTLPLNVRVRDTSGRTAAAVLDPLDVASPERQVDPARVWDLAALSARTGGTHARTLAAAPTSFALGAASAPLRIVPLRSWLWLLGLLLYLGDIVWRRRSS